MWAARHEASQQGGKLGQTIFFVSAGLQIALFGQAFR